MELMEVAPTKERNKNIINVPSGNLDEDFDSMVAYAKDCVKKEPKGIDPILFIIDSKSKSMGMIQGGGLPNDPREKIGLFESIGVDYAERMPDADCFILITEAWMSFQSVVEPSKASDKVEIFMVAAKRLDGKEKYHTQAFERSKEGKVTFLPIEKLEGLLNTEWKNPVEENGMVSQNNLLNALWTKFMFTKIVNQCK